jgi:predicted DNA-binding transcriptional regulator AlpA
MPLYLYVSGAKMSDTALQGLLRITQIVGDPRRGVPGLLPVSRATFYARVKSGQFPQPVRIGGLRSSFWRASDILKLISEAQEDQTAPQ